MANPDHFAVLKQGVEAWNTWRKQNPHITPDLSQADLRTGRLEGQLLSSGDRFHGRRAAAEAVDGVALMDQVTRGRFLKDGDFHHVDFSDANLERADLSHADMRSCNLVRAHLRSAHLASANLAGSALDEADLRQCDMRRADLTRTSVRRMNCAQAIVGWTKFGDIDLRETNGLELMRYEGPSTIGVDTIFKSNGQISERFLRGCGVPDRFITYVRALVGPAIEFHSCFISYSSHDQAFAERLHADLRARDLRVWFAPEDLKIGDRFQERIEQSIRLYDKVMIVLSEVSVRSRWVERELNAAHEREDRENRTVLFPIRIDNAVMVAPQPWAADIRRTRHIGDFCRWKNHDSYEKALERLLRDLRAETKTAPGGAAH